MIDINDLKRRTADQAKSRVRSLPAWRKLEYHILPWNMPFVRRLFPGWRDRTDEYMRSGDPPPEGGA